jgi:hypothetical protein
MAKPGSLGGVRLQTSTWRTRSPARTSRRLVGLCEPLSLGTQGRGGSRLGEVSAEGGHEERSEDDLSAAVEGVSKITEIGICSPRPGQDRHLLEGREGEPQEEDELEDKVEGEPVNNVDEALQHGEESKDNPVLEKENASQYFF